VDGAGGYVRNSGDFRLKIACCQFGNCELTIQSLGFEVPDPEFVRAFAIGMCEAYYPQ
jgi:hypothetical protein